MEINLYATLRPIVGQKTIEVELKPGANAQDLIEELVSSVFLQFFPLFPEFFLSLSPSLNQNDNYPTSPTQLTILQGRVPYLQAGR